MGRKAGFPPPPPNAAISRSSDQNDYTKMINAIMDFSPVPN